MPKSEQKGETLPPISAYNFSGGVQSQGVSVLAKQDQLLHILNGDIDRKIGAIAGRNGTTVKNATAKVVKGLKVYNYYNFENNARLARYIVVASDGSNQVIYTAQNSDFSGTLSVRLSGHFDNSLSVKSTTFANKEMFFNGVNIPKGYDGLTHGFLTITNAPVKGRFPEVFNQRLYVFGVDGFLHYSDVINSTGSDFTSTEWANRGINPKDGQNPMGMVRHRGRLVLFKTDSIYRFNGSNEPEPTVNVGLSSEDGYVTTDTHILFHHERDIYKMSLGDPVSISRPVEKFLRSVTPTNWSSISAGRDDRYAYFYIGDVTINDIFEWDYGKTYSNVVLAYNFLLERWTVYSGWNARVWCRDGYNGYLYFVTTSGDITYVDPSKYNDNGSAIEFQVMWHPIHYGSPRYRKKIDMVSLYGTPGISLRAGESPDKMESFGIYREEAKSVEIRHEIRFNSLWVGASESYKDSPPMIEQLHIGRGFIDAV